MNSVVINQWFGEALKPDPILTVSQWADNRRVLSSKSSAEAGPWRTSRTPYLKEIMDVLSIMHPAQKVVFMKASQIGGTETGNNWLGYVIDHAPGPFMLVMPTVDNARKVSRQRIEPLLEGSPSINKKVSEAKSRDSANTILMKDFPGGTLSIAGANSAAGLKSMPARFLMLDEVDEYPLDVEGQGDPIALVMARARTFSRRKAFLISTPTIDGLSKIADEFEISDKRYYLIPCPHCGHKQSLDFKNLRWPEGKPEDVRYYCEGCGEGIEEHHKTKMLAAGHWFATAKSHVVGFHINSLYSPIGWYSWAQIARDYDEAKNEFEKYRKTEKMKTFYNTILGLTYKEVGEVPEWKALYLRREKYKIGSVRKGVRFITCGVDVQKDRLEMEVVGWGERKISWSIDYNVIMGDTADEETWNKLGEYLETVFMFENSDLGLPIRMTAVDSGYNTQHVYAFCKRYPLNKVIAVKGQDNLSTIIGHPKAVDVKVNGKRLRRGLKVFGVGVSILKSELYGFLKLLQPLGEREPTGFCHFPEYNEDFFKMLTAEKMVIKKNRKGFATTEWVIENGRRNEALDCRNYARAAASLVGIDRGKDVEIEPVAKNVLPKPTTFEQNQTEFEDASRANKSPKPRKVRESSFW